MSQLIFSSHRLADLDSESECRPKSPAFAQIFLEKADEKGMPMEAPTLHVSRLSSGLLGSEGRSGGA